MLYKVITDPATGQTKVEVNLPKEWKKLPGPEPRAGRFSAATVVTKATRDIAQELLGNLPADELSKLRVYGGVPRKPGAPDAPILGFLPPLPKVEASTWETNVAGLVQGGLAWFLASRGLRATGKAAARLPGAPAVARAAAPYTQAARTTAAFAKGRPVGRVAVTTIKEAPASAVAGYAGFKPEEERLTDHVLRWVEEQNGTPLYGPLKVLIAPALLSQSAASDTASKARWKSAVESLLILDPAANAVVESIGLLAKATVRRWQARQAAKPAAEQVVDTSAKAAEPPTQAAAAGPSPRPKPKPKAVEVTEAYQAQRRTPMWEKTGTEFQEELPSVPDEVAKAEVEYEQALDAAETAIARAANTVPDEMGAVVPEARAVERPSYSQVREERVADIRTDPVRLQYKAGAGRTGATGSLKEAGEYDPLFGKIISVWRDPADGLLYVVNGHNRLELARRSGRETILTWEIEAPTAEQARAIGAMENMAEGMGTPWDAAKIMRDMGIGLDELRQRNINVRGPIAEKAIPLTRLPREIFERGATGKLDLAKAVALGSEQLDDAIIRDVAAAAAKGKWSAEKILQAMQEAKFAQTEIGGGGPTLPGMEEWATKGSDFSVRADVRAEAYRSLREEMIALTSAARVGRKDILEAAGNVIDVAGSQAARDQAAQAAAVFNRVTGYAGPVRDVLNEMVEAVKGGRTVKKVVEENLDRLRQAIDAEVSGPRLPLEEQAPPPATPEQAAASKATVDQALDKLDPETRAKTEADIQQSLGLGDEPLASTTEFVPDTGMKPLDPKFLREIIGSLTEDIRRIAGDDVAIRFAQAFQLGKRPKEWGGGESAERNSYINGFYDPAKDLIQVNAIGQSDVAKTIQTGFHESFHRVQINFLTEQELKALNSFWAQMKLSVAAGEQIQEAAAKGGELALIEQQAVAFQKYAYARKKGLNPIAFMSGASEQLLRKPKPGVDRVVTPVLAKGLEILDSLLDFVEKANNYLRGRGWTSIKSIFEQAYTGELAKTRGGLGNAYDAINDPRTAMIDAMRETSVGPLVDPKGRRLYSVEPEGPVPVDPPAGPENNDDWVRRFAKELEANRQALLNGEVTMEDLMANNFQKVQSPSGRTVYTAKREDLVDGLNAMSKVLPDRPTESGIPVMDVDSIRRMNQDWFTRHGEDGEAIMAGLRSLTRGFDEYQQGALNRAMAFADKKQVEAAQEAAMWLNSAHVDVFDAGINESERLARLVVAAESSRAAHQAVMRVTRRWGQLGLEMQIPRDYDIPPNQNVKDATIPQTPVEPELGADPGQVDVEGEIRAELEAEQAKPMEETMTNKLDPELTEAINGGEITPKAAAAADALAQSMVSIAADSKARTRYWRAFDDTRTFTPNALLMLRTNNLISGGVTMMTNLTNGLLNLAALPLQQASGAALKGDMKRAMMSLMMFQQMWIKRTAAMRVAGHSFKAGQSLFNLESSTVDYLGRLAKQEAQGELLQGPDAMTGWTVNTMNMGQEMAQKPMGQLANHLWRILGTGATRVALTIDTFNSTLAGYAYEHVRHLPRGMELAVERGMKDMSPEAWKWAQQYADARTQETIKDAVINGKNLADVHMDSPHAQKFMDAVNFTDDIWAELEPRTYSEGVRLGQARGLEGQDLQAFAKKYVDEGTAMNKVAEFFLESPIALGRIGSLPGEFMDTLASMRRIGPAIKFIQPFMRVPTNILKSFLRNTPAAVFVDTFWRDITSEDAFTRDRALGQIVTGSTALAMITLASAVGYVRMNGGGPLDPVARQRWIEIEGRSPYSFQLWDEEAGRWGQPISMRAMEPFATLFGAIGDYSDIANSLSTEARNRLGGSLALTLAQLSATGLLNKSYNQGINEIYEAFLNPSKVITGPNKRNAMARYLSRLAASMVPYSSAQRAARREVDPIARSVDPSDIGGLMGFFQETLDEVRNQTPGFSNSLPARRDYINAAPILTTGIIGAEQLPAELPFLQALMQFTPLSAMQVGRQPRGPVHEEMARLHGKGASFLGPRAADFGTEMRLTPSELEDYVVVFATVKDQFGRTFEQSATELIQSEQYQSWPIEGPSSRFVSLRAAAIQEEMQRYKELAKEQYKATTAKGQLILLEEAEREADRGEKNYLRRYGGGMPAQPSGAQPWSITPR
jgi:hypothetical protein